MLFTVKIHSRSSLRLFESPIAVMVPSTVDIAVARNAIVTETETADMISEFSISCEYHLSENPVKFVSDFDELNEKTTVTIIGI